MQSLYSKLRLVTKQAVNNLKNLERITSFESRFLEFSSQHSGYSSVFFLNENFGARILSPASSKSYGVASLLPYRGLGSCLNQSAPSIFTLPTRNITTTGSTSQDVSASPDVPQRIKFKRLDKTARHIMQIIDKEAVEEVNASREIPEIKPGYIVQLKVEVPENKRRVSVIKGIVIARRNAGLNTTFRIRRLVAGVGIESLFPLYSPNIKEIKVLDKKKVRRAKLYYLRDKMNALKKQ
ncbi:Mitochondrial/chloroplast ribosomal protein L19 [Handroanthus impetiginosus]|uniref:Mitochondrial/chloroplast ribosomal protein L19 n=1 Tax=Handroanthus impetiginosus TaxID=429701 RepID=A0A2G9I9D4_9LAMI|nr:Mitochondrial/chloroplast ribosomal protein L19 [Handroanthus impetiginosus]